MSEAIKIAIEDLKEISHDISSSPELPVDSPEDALTLDSLLTDVLNRVDQIIEDLQKESLP